MAEECLTVTAAACVLAQDIHAAARKCDVYLPAWHEMSADYRNEAVEDAVHVILTKRKRRMAKFVAIRR